LLDAVCKQVLRSATLTDNACSSRGAQRVKPIHGYASSAVVNSPELLALPCSTHSPSVDCDANTEHHLRETLIEESDRQAVGSDAVGGRHREEGDCRTLYKTRGFRSSCLYSSSAPVDVSARLLDSSDLGYQENFAW